MKDRRICFRVPPFLTLDSASTWTRSLFPSNFLELPFLQSAAPDLKLLRPVWSLEGLF